MVFVTTIIWIEKSQYSGSVREILMFSGVFLVIAFAFFIGMQHIKSLKNKEPVEDELSKKILLKTSSLSFHLSIFLWTIILTFSDSIKLETHIVIGMGILGMAIIFLFCWIGIKLFGLKNE